VVNVDFKKSEKDFIQIRKVTENRIDMNKEKVVFENVHSFYMFSRIKSNGEKNKVGLSKNGNPWFVSIVHDDQTFKVIFSILRKQNQQKIFQGCTHVLSPPP
jgi:ABC-type uncharacterized transport system substrate-binding protein